MTPYERLQWEAEQLGEGTHRVTCPWCLGGSKSERSLSLGVSGSGSLYFRCFRANCGKSGGKFLERRFTKPPRYFTGETKNLSDERSQWFYDKFGFVPTDTRYAPIMDRYIYSVRGPRDFKLRGYVARSFSGAEPKVLTYNERPGEPFIGWSLSPYNYPGPIVIVEDWVSAEKVSASKAAIGVALNGTFMGMDAACEIAECTLDRKVIFALDRDAYAKSVESAGKYRGLFKHGARVWRLKEDLKYVPFDVIVRAVSDDHCNDFGDDWARVADRQGVH